MKYKKLVIILALIILFAGIFIVVFKKRYELEEKYYQKSGFVNISESDLNNLVQNKESFLLYIHVPGTCTMAFPCTDIVINFSEKYQITIYEIDFKLIKNTSLNKKIKYSPTLVIFKDGKMDKYLDPNKESDLKYYKSVNGIKEWLEKSIIIKK